MFILINFLKVVGVNFFKLFNVIGVGSLFKLIISCF